MALREDLPVEDDIARLEPRVARIEADVSQLNARVANVEVDLRDLRASMDHKLEVIDAKFDHRLEVLTATMAEGFKAIDARFEKMDARLTEGLKAVDAKLDKLDAKFEGKFDILGKRRFALLITFLSAIGTLVTAVLGILLSGSHAH